MDLILIIGSGAVGKMTVGQELMKITDFRLFHNHMMIEPVIDIFGRFNGALVNKLREDIFEEMRDDQPVNMRHLLAWSFLLLATACLMIVGSSGLSHCDRVAPYDGGSAESADVTVGGKYAGEWYVPTDTDRYIVLNTDGSMSYGDGNHGVIASGEWVVIDEGAGAIKFTLRASADNEQMFEEGSEEFTRMAHAESDDKMTAQLYYSASEWETYVRR